MNPELVDRLLESLGEEVDLRHAVFVWHGGEPTVLPVEFYREVAHLQREASARFGYRVANAIQTNGTRLTPEWIEFLRENRWSVGVSVDGPAPLHDRHRVMKSGRGSFNRVRQGLVALREGGVTYGLIMVITPEMIELGAEAVWSFISETNAPQVNLLPVRGSASPRAETLVPQSLDPTSWSTFVTALFDLWMDADERPEIVFFDSVVRRLRSEHPATCVLAGRCFGAVYGVEPNGDIGFCPVLGSADVCKFGNIGESSLREMRRGPAFQELVAENEARLRRMRDCPGYEACAGGCPIDTLAFDRTPGGEHTCCGYLPLLGHAARRVGIDHPTAHVVSVT